MKRGFSFPTSPLSMAPFFDKSPTQIAVSSSLLFLLLFQKLCPHTQISFLSPPPQFVKARGLAEEELIIIFGPPEGKKKIEKEEEKNLGEEMEEEQEEEEEVFVIRI